MSSRFFAPCFLFLLLRAGSYTAVTAIRIDVSVEQTGMIAGRVVDAIGQPLPGVSVTTIPESGGLARRATTGSDGQYRFEMLSANTYRVDFELLGFDLARRNHVRIPSEASTNADAALRVSAICECVNAVTPNPLAVRAGQVADEAGRPLPHAQVAVVSPMRHESAYADADGRFLLRAPVDGTWPVTASDTGFRAATLQVSGSVAEPIVFRLVHAGTTGLPDQERFSRACRCPDDLFTHNGR